jgi:NAD(P)-dependent dehydrogenase (short-subunit alcohol dehydrogenase family)
MSDPASAVAGDALAGKVAIVTGGATGIGLATSLLLARHGASVAIFSRSEAPGRDAVAQVEGSGATALFVPIDLSDVSGIAPAVEQVVDTFGGVDILVNNAATRGIGEPSGTTPLFEITVDNWDWTFAVNLRAPLLLIQEVGRRLVEQGRGGHIVNVTSSAAFQAKGCSPTYAASKAGLTSLTRTAAAALGPHGITVNAVAPGITSTQYRLDRASSPDAFDRLVSEGPMENLLHTVPEPDDVAEAIVFLCLPASRQITAQTIHTSAGYIAP